MSVDLIDETFRQLFRDELPERITALESLLADGPGGEEFNAFWRGVHNIKGNAATFGFHPLVSVCHSLEDLLKQYAPHAPAGDPEFRRNCLALLDLMHAAAGEGEDVLGEIQSRLAEINAASRTRSRRALLIGDSRSTMALCRQLLAAHRYDVVAVRDAYLALHRALTEPFDILITTGETRLLKGEALIAALRLSGSRNQNALAVVLTSGETRMRSHKRNTDPDLVLARNLKLIEELEAALVRIEK